MDIQQLKDQIKEVKEMQAELRELKERQVHILVKKKNELMEVIELFISEGCISGIHNLIFTLG